ncbi:hypothetical protein PIB30_096307 [Stylosanthes scabra]|uniref:Uncharacterized protein n=1 Tax=Stylosanthes scabra TaxID=79078 RepID=A0ABU6TVN5_9FABA|nr:hypothetical protein [Stylosanthes scabra]
MLIFCNICLVIIHHSESTIYGFCGHTFWYGPALRPKLLRNKATNKWPTSKEELSKIGNIRCNLNSSQEDLNYPQLYKQGASPPQALGHAVGLATKGTPSYLEHRDLAPHSKSFAQSLRDSTLTLAPSVGNSYSRDKKCKCCRSKEPNHPAARSSLERALRETNLRGCNSLGGCEKTGRTRKEQQAILEEAEKREKDRLEKLNNKTQTVMDHSSKTAESKDHTWRPSTVVTKAPGRDKSKHPFSSHILAEEIPKKFRYPVEIEP